MVNWKEIYMVIKVLGSHELLNSYEKVTMIKLKIFSLLHNFVNLIKLFTFYKIVKILIILMKKIKCKICVTQILTHFLFSK
jgi:hypothetical protein